MRNRPDKGFSMIEVLVTIVILLVGLLGLAGLQARALTSQMESYQRSQALILLKDMAERIENSRGNGVTTATRGTGYNSSAALDCAALTGSDLDLCEWHNALLGTSEKAGGENVGAMIGARGCIYVITAPSAGVIGEFRVEVAWQGFNSTAVPALNCGANQYGSNDALRRVVSLPVNIASL